MLFYIMMSALTDEDRAFVEKIYAQRRIDCPCRNGVSESIKIE